MGLARRSVLPKAAAHGRPSTHGLQDHARAQKAQRKHNQVSSINFHPTTSSFQAAWEPTFLSSR